MPTPQLPAAPSVIPGYQPLWNRPDFQMAQAALRKWRKLVLGGFFVTTAVALVIIIDWDSLWRFKNFTNVGGYLIISVTVFGGASLIFLNPREERVAALRSGHIDEMLGLIVRTIRDQTNSASEWRWIPLRNAGATLFFTQDLLGVINLGADKILYVWPSDITDCRIESRNVGATTQIQESAVTMGGYGGNVLGAYTSGSATETTQQHYTHVVDVYTRIPGSSHLPLYFGENEAFAKEAYGRIRALLNA